MKEQEKDKSPGLLVKGTSYFLIYLTGIYPLNAAVAGGITPANTQTQIHHNGNVPVVNIVAPNSAGISHNTYKEFNTGTQGAVLNNATQAVNSQLAGQINANVNLQGKAAELIINEVTGSSRSELLGQLEVAGQKANVMIANPNGITCDGCGFINTSGAILTTGKPQFDTQGALDALTVTKGQITIGGKGLNGQSTDYVDIISRATELNGKIQANNLTLTQGANQISFKDGTAKPLVGEGTAPQLAVDTKALGGMYANKIRLVATEDGVGVNLNNLTSTQGDITLSSNGKMALSTIQAKTDLNAGAKAIQIAAGVPVQAERNIVLAGDSLENKGRVTAGQDMRLYSETVSNIGPQALLQANNNLWIQKNAGGEKNTAVDNKSGTIKTNQGDIIIRTQRLNNERENIQVTKQNHEINSNPDYAKGDKLKVKITDDVAKKILIDSGHSDIKLEHADFVAGIDSQPATIESGNNAYLYGEVFTNKNSNISAKNNLILTGTRLENSGISLGTLEKYKEYFKSEDRKEVLNRDILIWKNSDPVKSTLRAVNSLVADFKESIGIINELPNEADNINQVIHDKSYIALNAKNVLLNAKDVHVANGINAEKDINIIADNSVKASLAALSSGDNIAITSLNDVNLSDSDLKSKNIALISKDGNVNIKDSLRAFHPDNTRLVNQIEASGDLNILAGNNIHIKDTLFTSKSKDITFNANKNITIEHTDDVLNQHNPMQPLSKDQEAELFGNLSSTTGLNASGSVLMNSGGNLSLNRVNLDADKDIELYAGNDFNHYITAINRANFRVSKIIKAPSFQTHIKSGNNLVINAQNNVVLEGSDIVTQGSTHLLAGNTIGLLGVPYILNNDGFEVMENIAPLGLTPNKKLITTIKANKDINLISGSEIVTEAAKLSAEGNIIAISEDNMSFESIANHEGSTENGYKVDKNTNDVSELTAGGILRLVTNGSILFEATKLTAKGLGAVWKDPAPVSNHSGPVVNAESNIRNAQEKVEIIQREKAPIEKEVNEFKKDIKSLEDYLNSVYDNLKTLPKPPRITQEYINNHIREATKENREKLAPKLAKLTEIDTRLTQAKLALDTATQQLAQAKQDAQAKGDSEAKLQADIEAHNHAEAMRIGTIDVAAKGGYLYAKAQQHSEKREITRKSSGGFFSSGKTTTEISQKTGHDVGEFIAAGNLTMLSHGDSTYEASKIEAGKHIRLISTHGKVNFTAMPNTSFEQITSSSKGLFIKQASRGHDNTTWTLPSITAGSLLTVEANGGIQADVKTQKGQSLQTALTVLGDNPDTAWLKELTTRQDVKWNEVQDAYANWDYSHQQLSPAAAAVIAIAVAAVTAGSGLVVAAGASTASAATGVGAATATTATTTGAVVSGATIAGISSLASKAAVTLVNNQGNLSKTFKDLGSSDTVKSTITSMAIGGALAGFDQAMGWSAAKEGVKEGADAAASANSNIPLLSKGADWSQVAKRVAGQSIISSGLNTGINGGSFKDNFATALLSNVGNQINAEGANIIGDYGAALGTPGKAISHATVSAIAAHIAGGNARGAAVGALAAELGAVTLAKTFNDPAQILAGGRIIGGIAGAFATNSAEGVNSGANASEIVLEHNFLKHDLMKLNREVKAAKEKGEDTAPIFEEMRKTLAETRDDIRITCQDSPMKCGFANRWYADEAIEEFQGLGALFFDRDVVAFAHDEAAKDNAVINNYISTKGEILEYVFNGATILAGGQSNFSIKGKGGGNKNVGQSKRPYQPNQGAVGNMGEFFKQTGFGSQMKEDSQKTSKIYQGQSVYQASGNIDQHIKKGDQFYLDGSHKNHLEVFDKRGNFRVVLNLDGSINETKTKQAEVEGRKLK
ncbi:DUF637 domain-containing protein [Xenorhabdus sp. Flor]|uniref:DUF637 domain-containing protein n=1 Tax=Xenorhabdus cabanillasii TaxID=351673 RepID=UPI0019A15796|nr:DUF637 domain-containing protein [Xenorhabdus sp. Flor]MBD2815648.1 DUF637 domain-containing protein [Xenorhabdus sp. Flor]